MRPLFALLITGMILAVCVGACGATSSRSGLPLKTSTTVASASTAVAEQEESTASDQDKDNDVEAAGDDNRHDKLLRFGRAASPPDKREAANLIKDYYTLALADDGGRACRLLAASIAGAVPEDQGGPSGLAYAKGKTCAEVLVKIFAHFHARLALELPRLTVARVRIDKGNGIVLLGFGSQLPEREISIIREGSRWRLEGLLDNALP